MGFSAHSLKVFYSSEFRPSPINSSSWYPSAITNLWPLSSLLILKFWLFRCPRCASSERFHFCTSHGWKIFGIYRYIFPGMMMGLGKRNPNSISDGGNIEELLWCPFCLAPFSSSFFISSLLISSLFISSIRSSSVHHGLLHTYIVCITYI